MAAALFTGLMLIIAVVALAFLSTDYLEFVAVFAALVEGNDAGMRRWARKISGVVADD